MNLRLKGVSAVAFTASIAIPCATFAQAAPDEDEHHVVDEITVRASALERTVEQLAQPTSVLAGDTLAKKQAASIGETVSQELGVSSSYFGPVASRPVIRGQYGERVRVLSNALDSLDASALSEDHAVSVSSLLAESIEIVRGPATLLYGSGAAGGLVNVVDNRIARKPLEAPFSGGVLLGTDSAIGKESLGGRIAFGTELLAFNLDYSRQDTGNVQIPGFAESDVLHALEEAEAGMPLEREAATGEVENTDSSTSNGAAAVTLTGDRGFLGLSYSEYKSEYGIPGHEHEDENPGEEEEIVRIDLDQSRVDVIGELAVFEAATLKLRAGVNDYGHVELEGDEIGTVFDTQGTDVRVELKHGPLGPMDGAIGIQFKKIDFDVVGDEAFVPPSDTQQSSLFAFEEWAVSDAWTLQGSARAERQKISVQSLPDQSDTAYGFSVGAIWAFADNYSLAANLAITERNPTSTELYADGAHIAVSRYERGSVTQGAGVLGKELSRNLDLTARGENDRFEWSITAFVNDIDDYIILSPTADVIDDFQVFDYRQTDARLYGIEAEARIEIADLSVGHLHTRLFTDMVRGEDQRNGGNLPRIPPLRYGIGLHFTRNQLEAGIEATIYDDQDRTALNELPTNGYTLLSAEVSWAFEDLNLFLFARGTNLGDEEARQHTSPLKDILPLPGRSLQLGLRYYF